MIFLELATFAGIAAFLLYDTVLVFWLVGILSIFMGIGVGSDSRVSDRRFKTGFKGNEKDTSDIATGVKLILFGIAVCTLGYFARQLGQWVAHLFNASSIWWDLYGLMLSTALLGLMAIFAIARRVLPNFKTKAQQTDEPAKHYPMKDTGEAEKLAPQREIENDALRILLYVGKADGQLRAPERLIIGSTLTRISSDSIGNQDSIDALMARTEIPTFKIFKLAVSHLSQLDPSVRAVVLAAAEQIVATQKTIHTAEQEALNYLQKRLSGPSDA